MNFDTRDTFYVRLVLFMICLAVLGSFIAGIDYTEQDLAKDNAGISHHNGVVALLYDQCLHTCSAYYQLCLDSSPHTLSLRDIPCQRDREVCNTTCVESHKLPS